MACLYGLQENKDSALKYLNKALPFGNFHALTDPDFYFLHSDPVWNFIENKIFELNKIGAGIKDMDFAKKLYRLCAADQAFYSEIEIAEQKYGHDAKEVKSIWKKKGKINEQNQQELEALLNEKGWPKRSEVGLEATKS